MGSCQAQDTSHSFHNRRTYPLQEVLYAPSAQMILLANHEAGCNLISKQVRKVPEAFLPHTSASRTPHYHVIPCPFRQWGIDIVGPFPLAAGQRKFLLVAVDYFTKWVEAEPLARITEGEAEDTGMVPRLAHQAKIHHSGSSSANGQVEVTNRILDNPQRVYWRNPFSLVVDALKPIDKLDPTWEGPYKVTSVIGKGAYELEDPEGRPLSRPWNVHNLKKYFAKSTRMNGPKTTRAPSHYNPQPKTWLRARELSRENIQKKQENKIVSSPSEMEEKRAITSSNFFPTGGAFCVLGPEEEGEVPSGTAAGAGGASEGPAGGIAGAFSFFSAGSPSLGTTPSMESVAATGGGGTPHFCLHFA
ncbi:UNVERIFIED_CONTAM: hypothetical protein Slati_1000700 [Sesamum latifolium]|uniref:Integrase catalytic domain-containing protein n=1 Tax=Sesamum latifolium TaxID=2727402 RepID=A0AAW2XXS2_9LAMI